MDKKKSPERGKEKVAMKLGEYLAMLIKEGFKAKEEMEKIYDNPNLVIRVEINPEITLDCDGNVVSAVVKSG